MSETPAAHLAWLRVQYGDRWRIDTRNSACVAQHRTAGRRITGTSVPELEVALRAEGEWGTRRDLVMSYRGRGAADSAGWADSAGRPGMGDAGAAEPRRLHRPSRGEHQKLTGAQITQPGAA